MTAQAGADAKARHNVLNTLGAVLCRAGRHKEALARLREGIDADRGDALPADWLFLALAQAALGDAAAARKHLEKIAAPSDAKNAERFWADLEIDVLRREVDAVINKKD